jgi:hypothetical protein
MSRLYVHPMEMQCEHMRKSLKQLSIEKRSSATIDELVE